MAGTSPSNDLHLHARVAQVGRPDKVKVQLQKLAANGDWQTAGWDTVSIED
jgi:hypothetical protein